MDNKEGKCEVYKDGLNLNLPEFASLMLQLKALENMLYEKSGKPTHSIDTLSLNNTTDVASSSSSSSLIGVPVVAAAAAGSSSSLNTGIMKSSVRKRVTISAPLSSDGGGADAAAPPPPPPAGPAAAVASSSFSSSSSPADPRIKRRKMQKISEHEDILNWYAQAISVHIYELARLECVACQLGLPEHHMQCQWPMGRLFDQHLSAAMAMLDAAVTDTLTSARIATELPGVTGKQPMKKMRAVRDEAEFLNTMQNMIVFNKL